MSNQKFLVKVVHTCPMDMTMDANVSPDDMADMIMTKYSLNLFTEQDESVYKLLVEDMNMSMMTGGDVNDKFKPKLMSKLEETMADETLNLTNAAAFNRSQQQQLQNSQFNRSRIDKGKDILEEITSPFPIHEENLKPIDVPNRHCKWFCEKNKIKLN